MRLVSGPLDKLCSQCPSKLTKMEQLPSTNTFICPVCSGLAYYIPTETEDEQWMSEEEEE
jgi:NMD protein affecting ribosome stability and mRNA decay